MLDKIYYMVQHMWNLSGTHLKHIWVISRTYPGHFRTFQKHIWDISGTYLEQYLGDIQDLFGTYLGHIWDICDL